MIEPRDDLLDMHAIIVDEIVHEGHYSIAALGTNLDQSKGTSKTISFLDDTSGSNANVEIVEITNTLSKEEHIEGK